MNRLGRGYSFDALRAKILFPQGAFKTEKKRPKFERRPVDKMAEKRIGYALATPVVGDRKSDRRMRAAWSRIQLQEAA